MSTSVLICNSERKRKKSGKLDSLEKKLVSSFTAYSINLPVCRQPLSALTTTTTLFSDTEWKLSARMRSYNANTKARKRRLMSSSKECSKPRRNLINLIELLSKLRSIMKL